MVSCTPVPGSLILDLAGYAPEENLVDMIAVEPSCGSGEFLEPMVRRLSSSCQRQERSLQDCEGSIMAFDLSRTAVSASREREEPASDLTFTAFASAIRERARAPAALREEL
jgi:hypothetical protein